MTAEIIRSRVGQRAWCIAASVTLTQAQFTSASMQAALTYHSVTIPFTTRPTTLRLTSDFTCLFTGRPRAHWFRPRRIYALEKNVLTDQAYAWSFSVFFFAQNRFFGPRTAKSQPIWIKFCKRLLLYGLHLWVDLDGDRRVGGSRPNQKRLCFFLKYL